MADGETIIIRAASAEVEFDPTTFPSDPTNPRKHKNASRKITRIVITGDITFDSGDHPSGLKCEITASCR
jgi:hypothetical protein